MGGVSMEWKEVTLGEVSSKIGDGLHGTPKYDEEGSYYFINGNNLNCGQIIIKDDTKRVGIDEFVKNQKELNEQTILVSINGTIGNVAKYNNEPCILGKSACYINVIKEVDKEFIYYVLTSANFKRNITNEATGTTIKNVSLKQMREYKFNIPCNLADQRRIASILSSLDRKIELNNKINADLEEMAQAIFKNWFVDFEPFKDGKFVDSELGMIPEGWKVGTLGDFCKCLLGGTPSRSKEEYWNGDVNWINSGEINKFRILEASEKITELGLAKSATKLLPKKTTVLAITGATLGQVSLLEIDTCANQSVIGVLENAEVPYEYIYPFIKDRIEMLIQHQTGGAQQHINKDNVESLIFLLPAKNVLENYISLVGPMYKRIESQCFENLYLSLLRDTLLPRLMSGELEIPE